MKKIALLIIFCFVGLNTFAQSQAANWYFGYGAGIKFNQADNTISSVDDGQLSTNEGCTSISDDSGNLLFYTDGSRIWNKNHTIMDNGAGLRGDSSSTQSALIVPKPDDTNIYYVFTVDNHNRDLPHFGLNYSIVDLTLNGGLGSVTTKNTNLVQECSEKVTAVLKDCITKSIWVLTFASENGDSDLYNTFHAFEVSNTGVNSTAVKSTFNVKIEDNRGYLKLSPDGTKMACANASGVFGSIFNTERLLLYDFDVATGIVSNQAKIQITGDSDKPYGVEFSPNSQLLYVSSSNDFFGNGGDTPSNHSSSLIQFNLSATDIQNSAVVIDDRQLYRGGLQLGPNGKIYRALSATYEQGLPYLGAINNPNAIGLACNYQHNAVSLAPNNSSQGLPPFISSFFNTQIDIIKNGESATNLSLCVNDSYPLTTENIPGASYTWSVDGNPLPNNSFNLIVTQTGHYEVFIDPNNGDCAIEGEAFVVFNDNPTAYNHTILQCDEDGTTDGITLFNLNEANTVLTGGFTGLSTTFYSDPARTLEVDGSSFSNATNPQTIFVNVINDATGCKSTSELILAVSLTNSGNAALTKCDDDTFEDGFYNFDLSEADSIITNGLPSGLILSYFETYSDALLEVNNLGVTFTNTTPDSQTIYARVENANNCYGISEVLLTVNKLPNINTEETLYYCLNKFPEKITLNASLINDSPSNYTYNWSTGETTYDIQVDKTGIYNVDVTNVNGCIKKRTITVEPSNIASFTSIDVVDVSQNNTITVLVSGEGIYEYRLLDDNNVVYRHYQTANLFENIKPGLYKVQVKDIKNNCGTIQKQISVIGFPKFFTPNNDGVNDTWQVYGISSMFQPNSKIHIFNRFGKLLKQLKPLEKGWNGLYNGEKLPADDYWFEVILQDGRIFKNHFTLKL